MEPFCPDIESRSADPVGDLRALVEHVEEPAMVPMRAAQCLLFGHAAEAQDDFVEWVSNPNKKGLAMLALRRLDDLPLDVSTKVANASLLGPFPDLAKSRIAESQRPELHALLTNP